MADPRDPQVSRRYRELGAEEPPHALDEAILAASRNAAPRRRRWYVPVGAAAVLVLAVAVALFIDREPPGFKADTAPREARDAYIRQEGAAVPSSPASPPAAAPASIPHTAPRLQRKAAAEESPEQLLEQINRLREQHREEEAERALAEFRRRFPDHRLPAAAEK